jgi:hypothetical protein
VKRASAWRLLDALKEQHSSPRRSDIGRHAQEGMGWGAQVPKNHAESHKFINAQFGNTDCVEIASRRRSASHRCGACSSHVLLFHTWNHYAVRHNHTLKRYQFIKSVAVKRCAKLDWYDGSAAKRRTLDSLVNLRMPTNDQCTRTPTTVFITHVLAQVQTACRIWHAHPCPAGFSASTVTAPARGAGAFDTRAFLYRQLAARRPGHMSEHSAAASLPLVPFVVLAPQHACT